MAFDYTTYDYQSLIEEITTMLENASSIPGVWQDSYYSSTAQVLIQIIAAMVDNLMYMLERRTQENFLPTALLPTSVGAIANLIGYRPQLTVSASGTLLIVFNSETLTETILPIYTPLTFGSNDFVLQNQVTIPSGVTSFQVDILEGTTVDAEVNMSAIPPANPIISNTSTATVSYNFGQNYFLISDYSAIADNSFYPTTDTGQIFLDVTLPNPTTGVPPLGAITFASPTDLVFDVRLSNDGIRIYFGDGTFGEQPAGTLTIQWVLSDGPSVSITTFRDIETNTGPFNTFTFSNFPTIGGVAYQAYNITAIQGGLNAETVSQIQARAPDFIKTGNRAVTKNDFAYWTIEAGISGIIDASCWGEEELGISPTDIHPNNVYVAYLTNNAEAITSDQLTQLTTYLNDYKIATTLVIIQQAINIPLVINVDLDPNPNLSMANTQIQNVIQQALVSYFTPVQGSLGTPVYFSDIVSYLNAFQAVDTTGTSKRVVQDVTVTMIACYELIIPPSNAVVEDIIPIPVFAQPSPPVNQLLPDSLALVTTSNVPVGSPAFQAVQFNQINDIQGTDATGLSNTSTAYSFTLAVDSLSPQVITIEGSSAQTFTALLTSVNAAIATAFGSQVAALQYAGNMLFLWSKNTTLTSSVITISSDSLFLVLTNYESLLSPVAYTAATTDVAFGDNTVAYFGVGYLSYQTGIYHIVLDTYLPTGDYYITYSQNTRQNFTCTIGQYLVYDYMVLTDPLSTITVNGS